MIKIIAIGKIKEKYWQDAIKEYQKRLSKYTKLEILELRDINEKDIEKSKKQEAESIIKHLKPEDYIIALERKGETLTSMSLAEKLEKINNTTSNITFIIGGSNGLSERVLQKSDMLVSFSKLTFPHQLFRVILLEQIYRTYKIRNNEKYHK